MRAVLFGLVGMLALTGQASAQKRAAPRQPGKPSTAKPVPVLPVFSFLGDDTETPTKRTMLNESACTVNGDLTDCADYHQSQLGGVTLKWLSLSYNRGLLYRVLGSLSTNDYATLLAAFTTKYGAAKIGTRKWQAKSGATFDNTMATWNFKEGILELESLGTDLNSGLFTFSSSVNRPEPEKPKVDF